LKHNKNVEGTPWVSMGSYQRPDEGYGQIKITLSATVAQYLTLAAGDRVHVMVGEGDHGGWLRLFKRTSSKEQQGHRVTDSSHNCRNGNVSLRLSSRFLQVQGTNKTVRCKDVVPCVVDMRIPYENEELKVVVPVRVVDIEVPKWASLEKVYDPWHPTG
jgi:hypothetical protein